MCTKNMLMLSSSALKKLIVSCVFQAVEEIHCVLCGYAELLVTIEVQAEKHSYV